MSVNFSGWTSSSEILQISIYEHPSGWIWTPPARDYFNIWLALDARGVIDIEGQTFPFASGAAFIFPPGTRLVGRADEGASTINFTAHIRAKGRAGMALRKTVDQIGSGPVKLRNFIWATHLCRHLSDAFYLGDEENHDLFFSGIELIIRSILRDHRLPSRDPRNEAILEAIGRMRRNPATSYTVKELSSLAQLSPAHFSRRFKSLTGQTPNRFLLEERIARAESYLRETNLPVQDISNLLGYRDVYFFSRQFRRFRGVSPTALRRPKLPD